MNYIIDLQEISPNNWQAKYQGNYGIYTIKITTDGKKISNFSCSCPSDGYPCKHIAIAKEAIDERIVACDESEISVEDLLKDVPLKELRDFIIRQARYNPELTQTILLEFMHKVNDEKKENNYPSILRQALKNLYFDYEDLYDTDYCLSIDILDQWIEKAKKHIQHEDYQEAMLIAKACIEEYASWLENTDCDLIEYIEVDYQHAPFEILKQAALSPGISSKELSDYCQSEMEKSKYKGTEMYDNFNDFLMVLMKTTNPNEFIALQDRILSEIQDRSSYEARTVLQRKIDFYNATGKPDKAWEVIAENLQIESFRVELVKKKIAGNAFSEAKKLIYDFIAANQQENLRHHFFSWKEFLLEIAQKEKDTPTIRSISFEFIESYFKSEYYSIYKATFDAEEWTRELENIIKLYAAENKYFSHSVADVLFVESAEERLMKYIEKHLSTERIEKYFTGFVTSFREEALVLFRKAIDQYAEDNTGREHYVYIVCLLRKMSEIEGGKATATDMVNQYRIRYKNRRAMMEELNGFQHTIK
ncbi:SWIM zinc finger family protein [Viscerimonas tarda]